MKAVILAAGKGTRMKKISPDRPKHLIPIDGTPVLEHVIRRVHDAGVKDIILVVGYMREMIMEHFGDGARFGVHIDYTVQDPPTGTGSGVHAAMEFAGDGPFLMTYGDVLTPVQTFKSMIDDFESSPCDALILLNWVHDPYRGAAVYLDETGRITDVIEKPPIGTSTTHWNQSGTFVFSPIVFEYTARLTPSFRGEYELTHAVTAMLADGRDVRGCKLNGSWCDVGTPDDIAVAEKIVSDIT